MLLITGYVICGIAATVPVLAISVLFVSTGVALARPTFVAAISLHAPQERQGLVMGTTQSLVSAADMTSPIVAGLMLGSGVPIVWIASVVAVALLGALLARRGLADS